MRYVGLIDGVTDKEYWESLSKNGNQKTSRLNTEDLYHGLIRIRVKESTSLNRRLAGWSRGIVAAVGDGVIGNTSAFEAEESRFDP